MIARSSRLPVLPSKPPEGEPCNGCGVCCALEVCELGVMAFPGAQAPCPALRLAPDGSRTHCELVAVEVAAGMEPLIARALGVGRGCDSGDE